MTRPTSPLSLTLPRQGGGNKRPPFGGEGMKIGLLTLTQRPTRTPGAAWEEDLQEIIEADRLGVSEAWITEHFGPFRSNMLPLADLFICKAAALTTQIRLGPGI